MAKNIYENRRNIKGKSYKYQNLDTSFESVIAGQTVISKLLLCLLAVLVFLTLNYILGYLGGGIFLRVVADEKYRVTFIVVLLAIITWQLFTLFYNIFIGLINATLLILVLCILLLSLPSSQAGILKLPTDFLEATFLNLIFVSAVIIASFLSIRFFLALGDILFSDSKGFKIILLVFSIFATSLGSLSVLEAALGEPGGMDRNLLKFLYDEKRLVTASGIVFSLVLLLCSWLTNRWQNTPWKYPDLLRDWTLVIGSWGGTSFHNLDLSHRNFRGSWLANTDLRAKNLYRTNFQGVIGLERARVNNHYLDLENPKIQILLTKKTCSLDPYFCKLNLQGAYLQDTDMRGFDLTDTNLTGADLKGADLRESILIRTQLAEADLQGVDLRKNNLMDANLTEAILRNADLRDCVLVRTQVARADFTGADMTGVCIEDWSVSSTTRFTDVRCDYIYKEYQDGEFTKKYPIGRHFKPGEFASLFQKLENELELPFEGEFDYTALSLTFDKLQTDKPDLKLKLQGIEQRQNLWVVKVISDDLANVESRIKEIQDAVYQGYEGTAARLKNDPVLRSLISDIANLQKNQDEISEELKQLAKRNQSNFYILGGTIKALTGNGEITFTEASDPIRNFLTSGGPDRAVNTFLNQLRASNVATTANEQTEFIQFVIVTLAQIDSQFKKVLLQQGQEIIEALPNSTFVTAIQDAIAQLNSESRQGENP